MNRHERLVVLIWVAGSLAGCAAPLMQASTKGDAEAARAWLDKGADPDVRGGYRHGETALMAAAAGGHLPVVKLLVERGAKVNAAGDRGETALMRAVHHGYLPIVQYLIEKGADVNHKGIQGTTALHYAAWSSRDEIVQCLLDHGADVNAADEMTIGRTPLGLAAYFGDQAVAQVLLSRGADARILAANGKLPAELATQRGHGEISQMIRRAMAGELPQAAASAPASFSDEDMPQYHLRQKPDNYAVVVGVSNYAGLPQAPFARHDAQAVRDHLAALGTPLDHILFLTDNESTRAGLVKTLEARLPRLAQERSTVFFYFSGHALLEPKTGRIFLAPMDGDAEFLEETAYPLERLSQDLGGLKAARVLAMLEWDFPGVQEPSVSTPAPMGKILAWTSSRPGEFSGTLPEQSHGAFTYFLLRGLNGAGQDGAGAITARALYDYASAHVQETARRLGREQTPQWSAVSAGADSLRFR